MLNVNNTARKGIYKDLYRALEIEKKEKIQNEKLYSLRPKKGIYKDIYQHIDIAEKEGKHSYPLKALVFSNDIGEALRPVLGKLLARLSWIPAILYTVFSIGKNQNIDSRNKEIVFQGIASFLLPFLLIKASGKTAEKIINKASTSFKDKIKSKIAKIRFIDKFINKFKKQNSSGYRNFTLASVGLVSIATCAKPIDDITKNFLDKYCYNPKKLQKT